MKIQFLAILSMAATVPLTHAASTKPNVILFLVDDMGWMDCGVYGSQYYETPNMDRFAKRAMRFTNAYAQPLCSPTRASLLTGQYSSRHGVTSASGHKPPQPEGYKFLPDTAAPNQPMRAPESKNYLDLSEYTLAEALHDAGYRTAHIGKWHLGLTQPYWPEKQGFDLSFHCAPDPGPPSYFSPYGVTPDGKPIGKNRVGTVTDGPPGEYIVDRLTDEAIKFIEADTNRPFFLNLWQYGVHGPWGHKEAYTKIFALKKDPRGVQGNPIMASMLRSVDESFGRILDELDRLGITDNTIIIFNSDNGGNSHSNTDEDGKIEKRKADDPFVLDWRKWAGNQPPTINTPLRDGKASLYEGGTRVPLMWSWPDRIKPGAISDEIVGHIDLYPTLLDLLNLPFPSQQKIDGISYASVLESKGPLTRTAFFNYFPHMGVDRAGGVSVRSGDWKLIRWFAPQPGDDRRYELYNLRDDLSETRNLAATEPERVKVLDALIDGFLIDTGATYPLPNPAYKPKVSKPETVNKDPLEDWKARACKAEVKDGVLSVVAASKTVPPFLGHATGKMAGPVAMAFRIRANEAGDGKVEWAGTADTPKSSAFKILDNEWHEFSIEIPEKGPVGTMRLYLPPTASEIDWIDIRGNSPKQPPQRWDFGGQ